MSTRKEDAMMKMKGIGYWATTSIVAIELLAGGVTDLVHGRTSLVAGQPVAEVLEHLGYPAYLLRILGGRKVVGASALLAPRFPRRKRMGVCRRILCNDRRGCIRRGARQR